MLMPALLPPWPLIQVKIKKGIRFYSNNLYLFIYNIIFFSLVHLFIYLFILLVMIDAHACPPFFLALDQGR